MLYECSCGFTSITATAFYRHLAQFKDVSGTHQLVQARPSDLPLSAQPFKPAAPGPLAPASTISAADSLDFHQMSSGALPRPWSQTGAAGADAVDLLQQPAPRASSFAVPAVPAAPAAPAVPAVRVASSTNAAAPGKLLDVLQAEMYQQLTQQQQQQPSEAARDTDTLEINCRQPSRQDLGAAAGGAAMQDMFIQAGTAVSSLLLYGLNPLRLFGLTESPAPSEASRAVQGPVQAAAADPGGSGGGSAAAEAEARRVIVSFDAVLLWRDPWRSFRVFAMLLYMGICCQQLSAGALPILPSTALLAAALLYLTQNSIRASIGPPPPPPAAAAPTQLPQSTGGLTAATAAAPVPSPREAQELRLYLAVQAALEASARLLIPPLAAGVVLLHRALSGRRLVTTAIVWTCLWSAMFLGELRLMDQLQFAMLMYVALFTVPALYVRSREGLDVLVEDLVRLLLRLLLHSSRMALGGSALAALVALACTSGWSPVLRASAAAAAAAAVLLWQARPALQAAAPSAQGLSNPSLMEKPKIQ